MHLNIYKKHKRGGSVSLIIREIQTKHYTKIAFFTFQSSKKFTVGKTVGKQHFYTWLVGL